MGCGGSKQAKPVVATTAAVANRASTTATTTSQLRHAEAVSQDAWRHPDPMKSPYPQGKPDEVLTHLRDPEWAAEENIRVQNELVPVQMEGKVVKESYAIQQGYAYSRIQ